MGKPLKVKARTMTRMSWSFCTPMTCEGLAWTKYDIHGQCTRGSLIMPNIFPNVISCFMELACHAMPLNVFYGKLSCSRGRRFRLSFTKPVGLKRIKPEGPGVSMTGDRTANLFPWCRNIVQWRWHPTLAEWVGPCRSDSFSHSCQVSKWDCTHN